MGVAREIREIDLFDGLQVSRSKQGIQSSLDKMLKPYKYHNGVCFFSTSPQCDISRGRDSVNTSTVDESGGTSKKATDLYFKRCDGKFKNAMGEGIKA